MHLNIPRILDDHAAPTTLRLDQEIAVAVDRVAQLVFERSMIETHHLVQASFRARLAPVSSPVPGGA